MAPRSLPVWTGKSPDEAIPPRVRLRVFEAHGGRCQVCTRPIAPGDAWVCDHRIALINGGPHSEANLQPICQWCDRNVKTPADVAEKVNTYRKKARHLGIKSKSSRPLSDPRWRKMVNGQVVPR